MKTKLITTKDYLLLIDEEAEIKEGDYFQHNESANKPPVKCIKISDDNNIKGAFKVYFYSTNSWCSNVFKIAAYYPLTKESKELDLPLLPNSFGEVDVIKLAKKDLEISDNGMTDNFDAILMQGWVQGYKAAQSTHYSLENIKKAIELAYDRGLDELNSDRLSDVEQEEIIQSLNNYPLPKIFLPEYVIDCKDGDKSITKCDFYGVHCNCGKKFKTITNSRGKEVIQGKYVY